MEKTLAREDAGTTPAEEAWLSALDAVRDLVFLHDESGCLVRANSAYLERAGARLDDVVGLPYWVVFPKLRGPVICGSAEGSELALDGKAFHCRCFPVHGGAFALHILQDVTREKLDQQDRDHLAAIVEGAADGIFGMSPDGTITSWNAGAERLFGYMDAEAQGRHASMVVAPEGQHVFAATLAAARAGEARIRLPITSLTRDGRKLHVAFTVSPIPDAAGRVVGCSVVARDVTDRVQTEARLRRSEERLAEAQRLANIGNWDWDIPAGLLWWSDEIHRIFGLPSDQARTYEAFLASVHPEDRAAVEDAVARCLRGEAPYEITHRIVLSDGDVRYVHERGEVRRDASGEPLRMFGTAQDVTKQKISEMALFRLNRSMRALSECNQALIHATDELSLLDAMCRIIVEVGGYRMAWVGYAESDPARSVCPVAQRGYESGYLERAQVTWDDSERGRGPMGTAIRTGQPQICTDTRTEPGFAPWRADALDHGYASMAALPLNHHDGTVFGALGIYAAEADAFDADEFGLLKELADDLAFGITTLRTRGERESSLYRLENAMEATIQAVATTIEMRDPYTAGHQRRVAELAGALAAELSLPASEIKGIRLAAVIHDIGKIYVPSEILNRPGRLSAVEMELIKTHARVGFDILRQVQFPWPVAEMILQHHEKIDGSGYPLGLAGEEILLGARILCVADVVEAMASHRPYRPGLGIDAALAEIETHRGVRYDADVVDACLRLFRSRGFTFG